MQIVLLWINRINKFFLSVTFPNFCSSELFYFANTLWQFRFVVLGYKWGSLCSHQLSKTKSFWYCSLLKAISYQRIIQYQLVAKKTFWNVVQKQKFDSECQNTERNTSKSPENIRKITNPISMQNYGLMTGIPEMLMNTKEINTKEKED